MSHPYSLAHLRALAQTPEVDAVLLWDADEQVLASEKVRGTAKVAAVNTDLAWLLTEHDTDFALVAVRNDRMPAVCKQIAAKGVHLLVEQPIGNSPAAVAEVISAADRAGVHLGVCYPNRCHPLLEEARRAGVAARSSHPTSGSKAPIPTEPPRPTGNSTPTSSPPLPTLATTG